jgi:tetratricopeptide (TPR) repeat protein
MARPAELLTLALASVCLTACFSLFDLSPPESHYERALFETALESDPDLAHAHWSLGRRLMYEGAYREAIRHFRDAIASQPDLLEAHIAIGRCWLNLGHERKAARALERANALAPDSPRALELLGQTRLEQGDVDEAENLLLRATEIDGGSFLAWAKLGEIAYGRSDLETARLHWRSAVACEPTDPQWRSTQRELMPLLEDLEAYLELYPTR